MVADVGEAEVHDACASGEVDHDVVGFDVAVDNVVSVCFEECLCYLADDFEGVGYVQLPLFADEVYEGGAFYEFHGDVVVSVGFADGVGDDDVGVVELCGGACFVQEPFYEVVVGGEVWGEDFEGDDALEGLFVGFVDDAHASASEFAEDFVVAYF